MPIGYELNVAALAWRATDSQPKALVLTNTDTDDFWVEVPPPAATSPDDFRWSAQTRVRVAGGPRGRARASFFRTVIPPTPRNGLGLRTAEVVLRVTDAGGALVQEIRVPCRNDATAKVIFGDLAVTRITFNPPGDDLAGEVEFVELTNLTSRTLDLSGCKLEQMVFATRAPGAPPAPGTRSTLVAFRPDAARLDFGNDCLLPPRATLRVLTRGLASNEGPSTVPDFRQRFYVASRNPVWNNDGDRATLRNEFDDLVCSQGYGREANSGPNGPSAVPSPSAPPVITPPAQRRVVFSQTVMVMANAEPAPPGVFTLEPGDLVDVTTDESALAAAWLNGARTPPGTIRLDPAGPLLLPSGRRLAAFGATWIDPAVIAHEIPPSIFDPSRSPPQFYAVGAPQGALIGFFAGVDPFLIGAGLNWNAQLAVPRPLMLGVNDIEGQLWNNSGFFNATVTVRR